MGKLQDLSAVLTGLYDQPLLGPKPDQLLIFKRPQLALKLQCLLQPATSAAAKHSNLSVVNQAIAAMYEHPALHDHVAGWAPVRSGQHNVHPCDSCKKKNGKDGNLLSQILHADFGSPRHCN